MVDVSKRLSGSPKIQPKPIRMKKWMSEPNILQGDDEDDWIKEKDNMEEKGVSFSDEVPEPSQLVHINKQRVQLRPKRRLPSRDFVKSRASMDFDIAFPEEIKEEEEDSEDDEITENVNTSEVHTSARPTPPIPAPKPTPERNGWKLPTPASGVVLRKTNQEIAEDVKSDEVEEIRKNGNDITPQSSPEKKHKEQKRIKHLFKFRRSRKEKIRRQTSDGEIEGKTNLTETYSMSVDSGLRPLGEESRRRKPNRRSAKSDRKGLNWLLGLFHKKSSHSDTKDTKDTENIPGDNEDTSKDTEELPTEHVIGSQSDGNSNGDAIATETVPEDELKNGHTSSHKDQENPETVSDLRQKFERLSVAF
ncbi:uncharacterized protein LOC114532607 [Dendronephthya gigantea]|uniref:uncharacterized protein LOC114532607 n=1 Tax=Dendronephthya gigantea TaxID=151771 RepID=UPI00106942EF|nr:uncharacterized protein LOC114532607 [Dendronephthya gigantea]